MKPVPSTSPPRRRALAHPWLSLLLATSWLVLQESLAPAQVLWAVIFGLVLPWLLDDFLTRLPGPRRAGLALRLLLTVLWDIVVSNLVVARIVLDPSARPQPGWVAVPTELQHPNALTLLATIITMTPGTVSCVVDDTRHGILVHVLDLDDAPALVGQIKARYEAPLKEILG